MDWTPNDMQRSVLAWLCGGRDSPPPSDSWKHSARALESRGLVEVSRAGGGYTVIVTDVGQYMQQHGGYPVDSAGGRQTRSEKPAVAAVKEPRSRTAPSKDRQDAVPAEQRSTPPELPPELSSRRLRNPHQAVRSLRDWPGALPADPAGRRRGLVAAQILVEAAEAAGMSIQAHDQPRKRAGGSPYTGADLVTLDAGHSPVTIRIGEYERRVPHVETAEERKGRERFGYSWAPAYDYIHTGLICFRVYRGGGQPVRLLETHDRPLTAFVPKVIAAVQAADEQAIAFEDARRRRVERERKAAAHVLAERRGRYAAWETALVDGAERWERVRRLREYVDAVESEHGPRAREFLTWAHGYVEQQDPVKRFSVPEGGPPDLAHEEEAAFRNRLHASSQFSAGPDPGGVRRPMPDAWQNWS